jgi:hypothetical protein
MDIKKESQGLLVSPPIKISGASLISIAGRIENVLDYAEEQGWNPSRIIVFGQNGHGVKTFKLSDVDAHLLVVIDVDNAEDIAKAAASISKVLIDALLLDGFDYAHKISLMKDDVTVGVFNEEFDHNTFAHHVMRLATNTWFEEGRLKFADSCSYAMLFIGREGKRSITAQITGSPGEVMRLSAPFIGESQMRCAIISNEILVVCGKGIGKVYVASSKMIKDVIAGKHDIDAWVEFTLANQSIEDVAIVDGSPDTIILTIEGGEHRLLPVVIRQGNERFSFMPALLDGLATRQIKGVCSPVVRVNHTANFVSIADKNGASSTVRFHRPEVFGKEFVVLIEKATLGKLSVHSIR